MFDECFNELILVEGGYANDPYDSGGETAYGITVAVARAYGYLGEMREMSLATAKQIYRERYWAYMWLDQVALLSPAIAKEMFDSGVNCGQAKAVGWLQTALNRFNKDSLYADIEVDGGMGRMTLAALKAYFDAHARFGKDAGAVLLRALNSQQGAFYLDLAESRPKDERFVFGWFRTRVA